MAKPRVLILRAPGTNCDRETEFAFERAGGEAERVHINRLLEQPDQLHQYQILCVPGGFSYGDDIAAGRILAGKIRSHLPELLAAFRDADKLILGICNGFQVLMQTGVLLPTCPEGKRAATLAENDSGKFEDRWVQLSVTSRHCPMLRGIEAIYLPVAHAEGRFVSRDAAAWEKLESNQQLVLRYGTASNGAANTKLIPYPENPNGSVGNVAGICDPTGRVLGMMPHPERFIDRTHHPRWTREKLAPIGDGLKIFQNAVAYFVR